MPIKKARPQPVKKAAPKPVKKKVVKKRVVRKRPVKKRPVKKKPMKKALPKRPPPKKVVKKIVVKKVVVKKPPVKRIRTKVEKVLISSTQGVYLTGQAGRPQWQFHQDALHRALWRRTDRRGRVAFKIADLVERYDVNSDIAGRALLEMRAAGRIRKLQRSPDDQNSTVYEIADPQRWDPDDPSTHARIRTTNAWG